MKIKKIEISVFKSLGGITLDNLRNLNIFIGKNNSGKSNIFEVINLFYRNLSRTKEELPIEYSERRIVRSGEIETNITFLFEVRDINEELNQKYVDDAYVAFINDRIKDIEETIKNAKETKFLEDWKGSYESKLEFMHWKNYSFFDFLFGILELGLDEVDGYYTNRNIQSIPEKYSYSFLYGNDISRADKRSIKEGLKRVKFLKLYYSFDNSSGPFFNFCFLDSDQKKLLDLKELIGFISNPQIDLPYHGFDFVDDFAWTIAKCFFETVNFESRFNAEEEDLGFKFRKIMTESPEKFNRIVESLNKVTGDSIKEIKLIENKLMVSFLQLFC